MKKSIAFADEEPIRTRKTMKIVAVKGSRTASYAVTWTVDGEQKSGTYESRVSLFRQIRTLNAVGIPVDAIVRTVSVTVNAVGV